VWLKAEDSKIEGIEISLFIFCHIDIKKVCKNSLKFAKNCRKFAKVLQKIVF